MNPERLSDFETRLSFVGDGRGVCAEVRDRDEQ